MIPYRDDGIPGSPGPCPRCGDVDLEPKQTGEVTVAVCRQCHGLWLGGSTMIALFLASEVELGKLARLDDRPLGNPTGDARCPRCREVMARQAGAVIEYDTCDPHGLWFDQGELRALLAHAGIELDAAGMPPEPKREIGKERPIDKLVNFIVGRLLGGRRFIVDDD